MRTLLVRAVGDVAPEAFRRGAVGGHGARRGVLVAFAVATLSGVVEEEEAILLFVQLHL